MDVLRPLAEWHAALSRYPLGRNHFFPSQAYLAQRVPSEVCQNPAEGFLHAAEDISKRSGVRQLRWVGQSGYGENRLGSKGNDSDIPVPGAIEIPRKGFPKMNIPWLRTGSLGA